MTRLRLRTLALAAALVVPLGACEDFLNVNENPNAPQQVSANLYLPPMLHWLVTSPQFDGRFIGRYTQQWTLPGTVLSTWDRMGYDPASDNGAQQWRDVYWNFGQNLQDMKRLAAAEQRWDLLGVGLVLEAWGWQVLTDQHGEIIIREAFDQTKFVFEYDNQEFAYQSVRRLLDSAIVLLRRTDGAVSATYLARGDRMYNGDRNRWRRFAFGLLALHLNHYTAKAAYNPAAVIAAVDSSFTANTDDALLAFPGTQNDDINFWGRTRNNLTNFRQTQFVVGLMNGTNFGGGTVDPRMSRMLSPAPDGVYRGLDINVVGFGALTPTQQPNNFHGYPTAGGVGLPARYIFDDRSRVPAMTYAQLQFVKAEAALRQGDRATALTAYRNGINAHLDFVNARNLDNAQTPTQITAAERTAYLASAAINPTVPANLTLTQIMVQKYIAQWGWGHNEVWMDMRRFNYTGNDPNTGLPVYPGFAFPTNFFPDNGGRPAMRIRARYNSEYVWNRAALDKFGGLAVDYHTVPLWITQP
jgi:hypothetical protein